MIQMSPAAVREVLRLKLKQNNPQVFFRLGVKPGGCCDWYYTMGFDEKIEPNDRVISCGDIQVVIETQSLSKIDGLTLDYSQDLMGGGFRFNNPNASQTCGCSHSFVANV